MIRKLHIGGRYRVSGWEVMDAVQKPHVDHLGDAKDLSRFQDCTFSDIYASHVLEHFDYKGGVMAALMEWRRVLRPGGKLFVSVPDMDALCALYTSAKLPFGERFIVMRMMFGGHSDEYDYHMVGLNEELLRSYLTQAGFSEAERVNKLGLFSDASSTEVAGVQISLNMIVTK